jgi:preprotein translocase subunit Sec63
VLAKTNIQSVKLPAMAAPVYRGNDPYMILGIPHSATVEQVKEAYHKLCFTTHPDRVRGLGLGGDFVDLATQNMMRINSAYSQILRTMRAAAETGAADSPADSGRKKAA